MSRFNAQIELADYALGLAAVDVADVRKLASLLSIAGHHGLRATLLEAAAELGYCAPDGGPAREPGQPPHKPAASNPTKSASCDHNSMMLIDKDKPLGRFVWECADCGYIYGRDILVELEDSIKRRGTADFDGAGDMETLIDKAVIDLREMRTTLKQCRSVLQSIWKRGYLDPQLDAAITRIDSIIPPSEV